MEMMVAYWESGLRVFSDSHDFGGNACIESTVDMGSSFYFFF